MQRDKYRRTGSKSIKLGNEDLIELRNQSNIAADSRELCESLGATEQGDLRTDANYIYFYFSLKLK